MDNTLLDGIMEDTAIYADDDDLLHATMTSRDIAIITGKRHSAVRRDILNILACTPQFNQKYSEVGYGDLYNRRQKEYILSGDFARFILDKYAGMSRIPHRLREESALTTIEQILGITLMRQHPVLTYRLDGYCKESNTAYEIDEQEHKSKTLADAVRQAEIESIIGCKFVRIRL